MKNKEFKTIALACSHSSERVLNVAKDCYKILIQEGVEVQVDQSLEKLLSGQDTCNKEDILENSELVISIGGDGTMLGIARDFGSKGLPILGINLGNLGFLADLDPADISTRLKEIISGDYKRDERSFLEASIKGREEKLIALNEIVLHSGNIANMIEFDLFINESYVYTQRADGLIVGTTTGSTAYSLSAGGPIIHPDLGLISLIPMFPQSLTSSPFLVSDSSIVRIVIKNNIETSKLNFDGSTSISLEKGEEVLISKAKSDLNLVHPQNHDFFDSCRDKLGWGKGIVKG
jgi:NAD+ kinase|tara:strand:+ start:124 stop:996 length:873 start_codon:yes stop_codon:yes gene_type:complete